MTRSAAVLLVFASVAAALVGGRTAGAAAAHACPPPAVRPPETLLTRARWLANTVITEYYPAPERWFSGRLVRAPGIRGLHHVDWLYGGEGLAMEGDGIGSDGRPYHFRGPYSAAWVNAQGQITSPCPDGSWTGGRPVWLDLGWRSRSGAVTYPLAAGGWSAGASIRFVQPPVPPKFGSGPSLPLVYWQSVAVDPKLIPIGSRIFVPAYCRSPSRGWFVAADTGGAIIGRHIDVYRPPPTVPFSGRMLRRQMIFVVPPGAAHLRLPRCEPA